MKNIRKALLNVCKFLVLTTTIFYNTGFIKINQVIAQNDRSMIYPPHVNEILKLQNNNCPTELSDVSNALHLEILELLKNNQEQRLIYLLHHPESDSAQIHAYRKAILKQIIQFSSK